MSVLNFEAAVEVARKRGEHYPVCGMPPREVMINPEAHREWKAAKREACSTPEGRVKWWKDNCTCWKREMEDALHG